MTERDVVAAGTKPLDRGEIFGPARRIRLSSARSLPLNRKALPGALAALLLLTGQALAANGLNPIGFGAESVGMGGADLAVARDTTAMNTNPAGLAQLPGGRLDL